MRIAHVSVGSLPPVFSNFGGAIQRRVAELASEQARRGHEVTVFSPGERPGSEDRDGVSVRYVRTRIGTPLAHLEYQLRVLTVLASERGGRPQIAHFHSEPEAAVFGAPLRVPTVLSYDNYFFRGGKASRLYPAYRAALRRFDLLLPCSEYCARKSTEYWTLPGERVEVLYNGVDTEQFRPESAWGMRERARLGLKGPVLMYLGRVCRQKGSDVLLAAFEELRRVRPELSLVLVGPIEDFDERGRGGEIEVWQERISAAGAKYLGAVPEARLAGLLNMADLLVMPTVELEMFGMAAMEAEACGTPVVASDHGGLPETVPPECGIRFRTGDARDLARSVLAILDLDDRRAEYASHARQHALSFSWHRIAERLDKYYEQILLKPAS